MELKKLINKIKYSDSLFIGAYINTFTDEHTDPSKHNYMEQTLSLAKQLAYKIPCSAFTYYEHSSLPAMFVYTIFFEPDKLLEDMTLGVYHTVSLYDNNITDELRTKSLRKLVFEYIGYDPSVSTVDKTIFLQTLPLKGRHMFLELYPSEVTLKNDSILKESTSHIIDSAISERLMFELRTPATLFLSYANVLSAPNSVIYRRLGGLIEDLVCFYEDVQMNQYTILERLFDTNVEPDSERIRYTYLPLYCIEYLRTGKTEYLSKMVLTVNRTERNRSGDV